MYMQFNLQNFINNWFNRSRRNSDTQLTTLPKACLDPKGLIASGMSKKVSVRALSLPH